VARAPPQPGAGHQGGGQDGAAGLGRQGASRKHLLDAIDASLARLQVDHVDLYQLHHDDRNTPLDESLEALDTIVRSGRARYVGVSNFLAYRLARALGRAEFLRVVKPVCVQPRYSLLFREIERELLPLVQEEGLGVIPYNPLAGGLLTGKYRRPATRPRPTRASRSAPPAQHVPGPLLERTLLRHRGAAAGRGRRGRPAAGHAGGGLGDGQPADHRAAPGRQPARAADGHAGRGRRHVLDPALKKKLDALTADYRKGDAPR
jgi:aryl-alcohol dehydrogenase-like predicted oxidoreductase